MQIVLEFDDAPQTLLLFSFLYLPPPLLFSFFFFFESVTHWKYCRSISFFVRGIESDMGRVHKFKLEQMYVRKADCACMTQPLRGLGLGWGCGGFGGVLCVFRLFFLLTIIAGGIFSLHIGGP